MQRAIAVLALLCVMAFAQSSEIITPTLIKGTPVEPGTWQEVIRITSQGAGCTATIVGRRTIITAAHCAGNGRTATFNYKGKSYSAKITHSPLYPGRDHDVALGVVAQDIAEARPMSVGGTAKVGDEITLLGYGCINPQGTGGNDGILRIGKSQITGFSGYDMVSRMPNGAALCYGDSGGPAFTKINNQDRLLGINSKGNISDTNYNARLDRQESLDLMKKFASDNSVVICGINSTPTDPDCTESLPTPDPSCRLTATPSTVPSGGSVSLVLAAENATSADIDGTAVSVPNGEKRINPTASFTSTATVRNAVGKSATCTAPVTVTNDPLPTRPECTLTAIPAVAKVGEIITLELQTKGGANTASINGNTVSVPLGRMTVSHTVKAQYSAVGFVRGAGGSNNCFADYQVGDGGDPAELPELALVPTHCGPNHYPQTGIKSACLASVKRDSSWKDFFVSQVVLLTYADNTQEVLPMLASKPGNSPGGGIGVEEWTNAVGTVVSGGTYPVLDTKYAKITKQLAGGVPTALEGRNYQGKLYLIQKLSPFNVRQHLNVVRSSTMTRRS